MSLIAKIIALLKRAGIDYSKMAGKVDPNKISQLITKTQKTATKPKLIDALNKDKATFDDAIKIFENDAKYLSQMNEMEQVNFANNLEDYFTVGGKIKYRPSNVVTQEGAPVVGKKLETLAARKGAKEKADDTSLRGAMEGLMTLVDDMKGISPKMRNQMDRDELVKFIQKMRGEKFSNQEIKMVRDYMDQWGIGLAKEKRAPAIQYAKKLKAKTKEEFEFVEEYLDNIQTTSPEKFREMYGNVKNVNMDINTAIEKKLEKHFRKKYKWDNTKQDGGLDDATFEKYDDELYEAQKEFSGFHTVYDTDVQPGAFGTRKSTSWANHPREYLDEASEKLQSITGEGLNVDFWKNYTDDVLTKYPKPESFQYGGIAGMLGEPTYQDEDHRVPLKWGKRPRDLWLQLLDEDWDDMDPDEWKGILKSVGVFQDGGRVPFSKGNWVVEGLPAAIRKIMEKFGKKSITTADKIKRPLKAIEAEDTKAAFDRLTNKINTQEALSRGSEKMAGPIKTKNKGAWDPESTDYTTWLQQEKFFDPKALDMYGKKVPSNWIEVEKKAAQKMIDDLGPLDVSPNHPNYKDMKAIRQSAKDRLESIKVTEALGGNITMHDWLRMNRKNLKMSDYIRKEGAPVVKDELSGIKKAFIEKKSSPWFKDSKTLTPEEELRREFPGIDDNLIKNILADDNPQRIAEVKATLKEAMKMQEKGMGVEEILNVFKKKPTKHASGGRVSLSSGGLAGMLGE